MPHLSILRDPEFVARFKLEVQSLVTLSHPQIVKVIDVDQHGDLPFVVLQYLPGGNLESRLYPAASIIPQPQSISEVCKWLKPIATALDYIHSRGYIHRDIKPANILFDAIEHPYLTDFGIAKVLVEVEAQPTQRLTATGVILGTAEYMAPELLQGKPFDHRVDQYALAVTVFEALSGTRPYDGNTPAAIALAQVQQPVPNLHERATEMPVELSRILTRALSRSPEDRFGSCLEFASALRGTKSSSHRGTRQATTLTNFQAATSTERVRVTTRLANVRWRPSVVICLILLAGALAWAAMVFLLPPPSGSNLELSKPGNLPADRNPNHLSESVVTVEPMRREQPEFSSETQPSIPPPVSPPQPALQLAPLADVTIPESEKWTLKATAIPVSLNSQQLRFALGAESPAGCEIDEETGVISWTPTEAQGPGRYLLSIVVSSQEFPLLKAQREFNITVLEVNQRPNIDLIADQSVDEVANFQFKVKAHDPDQPPSELQFALQTDKPVGASINQATGVIDWKPQTSQLGIQYAFRVNVSEIGDPQSFAQREFKVCVHRLPRHDILWVENTNRIDWLTKANMTGKELQIEIDQELKSRTRRPTCISGYRSDDGFNRYTSVWVSDSKQWAAYFDLNLGARSRFYNELAANSFGQKVLFNGFIEDGGQVITVEDSDPSKWEVRDFSTFANLDRHIKMRVASGYQPVAVFQRGLTSYGVYLVTGKFGAVYYAGIPESTLRNKLSSLPTGYHPIWIDGFGRDRSRVYSFVAVQDGNNPKWYLDLGLKPKEYEQKLTEAKQAVLLPLVIDVE
jgi:serine/threonine protein kinase